MSDFDFRVWVGKCIYCGCDIYSYQGDLVYTCHGDCCCRLEEKKDELL